MAYTSPDTSSWDGFSSDSEDEQVFHLDEKVIPAEDATSDSWAIVKPTWNNAITRATPFDIHAERQICDHFASRDCALEVSGQCCQCSDKRPISTSGLYSMYVDGHGFINNATRWAYYCPACKEYEETAVIKQIMQKMLGITAQKDSERKELAKHQCEHWLERGCLMTGTGSCCACSDLRPGNKDQLYRAYVDGLGFVGNASRWEHYCPACKEYDDLPRATLPDDMNNQNTHVQSCSHFHQRDCLMSSTNGNCCACADQRPPTTTGLYDKYIDGRGWVREAARWEGYCPNCQAFHSQLCLRKPQPVNEEPKKVKETRQRPVREQIRDGPKEQHTLSSLFVEEACDHWASRHCALTSSPKQCCACADKRPQAPSYSMYVDGMGWIMGAKRWVQYCPGCRQHHELVEPKPRRPRYRQMPKVVGLLC